MRGVAPVASSRGCKENVSVELAVVDSDLASWITDMGMED